MAAPNVTVTVEPSNAGSILVCELAPLSTSHPGQAQLSLRFDVTNSENSAVHLSSVGLQFPGSPAPAATIPADLLVAAHASGEWHFAPQNNVILPWPGTSQVIARLSFDGYSTPIAITAPLAAHVSPVEGGAYVFPFNNGTLGAGEYFSGRSGSHGAAGGGVQLFAYDIGVVAIDEDSGNWSGLHPGTDGSNNEHYRIWGKPIYAMADGTVVTFADQYPANPNPPADLSPPNPVEAMSSYSTHICSSAHCRRTSNTRERRSKRAITSDSWGIAETRAHHTSICTPSRERSRGKGLCVRFPSAWREPSPRPKRAARR